MKIFIKDLFVVTETNKNSSTNLWCRRLFPHLQAFLLQPTESFWFFSKALFYLPSNIQSCMKNADQIACKVRSPSCCNRPGWTDASDKNLPHTLISDDLNPSLRCKLPKDSSLRLLRLSMTACTWSHRCSGRRLKTWCLRTTKGRFERHQRTFRAPSF